MIESGGDCVAVLTQLPRSRARPGGFKLVASGLRHCQTMRERGEEPPMSEEELRLFLWPEPRASLGTRVSPVPLFACRIPPGC